ncbi:hypothetical protein Pan97_48420 [Bremerella volcania]|uniref:Uncharacterized protein n=1 Tax=Bremerella volcania TaxID=2527984 RepID=A0A518CEW1_9BACT|nr:hypothetical protein [Bremerella volcania]QDU77763.1 hypothetical protein Pan97_48420 [Bremerella volcania]
MYFDAYRAIFVTQNYGNPSTYKHIVLVGSILALWVTSPILAEDTWKLTEKLAGKTRRVSTELKVQGTMRVNPDGKKVRHYPVTLDGKYVAIERVLGPASAVRFYETAETHSTANEKPLDDKLPTVKRLISVDTSGDRPVMFSPQYTLTREELELISVPGNPAVLAKLFPYEPVAINQTWSPDDQALAQVLGIDAINNHEVVATLTEVDKAGIAKVSLEGKVSGAIQGVATEIELKGRLNLDTRNQAITWFAASIKEDRSIGHAIPGFDVTAIVRTQIEAAEPTEELSDANLAKLNLQANDGSEMLAFEGKEAGFRLMHDRRWHAMAETPKQTVFRMVADGELIAQANVNRLTNMKAGEQMTLEGFEAEVKKALKERLGQVVDASQAVNSQGLRELRVTAVGTANKMPITWIYYLISDDNGRRYSTVFTFETSLAEKFGQTDRSFMSGFDLIESAKPTIAKSPQEVESKEPALISAKAESLEKR